AGGHARRQAHGMEQDPQDDAQGAVRHRHAAILVDRATGSRVGTSRVRAFWLLVLPLLAFAGYLAVRVTRESDTLRRHELQTLLDSRLADVRTRASHAEGSLERQL